MSGSFFLFVEDADYFLGVDGLATAQTKSATLNAFP